MCGSRLDARERVTRRRYTTGRLNQPLIAPSQRATHTLQTEPPYPTSTRPAWPSTLTIRPSRIWAGGGAKAGASLARTGGPGRLEGEGGDETGAEAVWERPSRTWG
jgi:hypothetical protein